MSSSTNPTHQSPTPAPTRRPPRFRHTVHSRSPSPSSPTPVTIYVSAAYRPSSSAHATTPQLAAAAAYGLYIDTPSRALPTRLSEPLNARHQSPLAATLAALAAALRIVPALPAPAVRILLDDHHIAHLYNAHAPLWRNRSHLARPDKIWHPVALLVADLHHHPTNLHVTSADHASCPKLRKAADLARQAMDKHAFCRLCRRNYGRPGAPHDCHPVCFIPPCRGTRFKSIAEYERHVEDRHPIAFVYPEGGRFIVQKPKKNHTSSDDSSSEAMTVFTCPSCKATFVDLAAFETHVETTCPDALGRWFSQTKIVKL